jgi:peptidyl-prolyl cis-trans isomerase D
MRKHAKSWLIKTLIGMIAVVFVFYFGYSFTSRGGVKIAYVNGEPISGLEYQKTYRRLLEALQRDYKNVWSENLIEVFDLKNRALENLINQKLIDQEARRMGLDVTEKEIQDAIIAYPAFQFNGRFDENRYRSLLDRNRMSPEDFEAGVAQDLLQKKLTQLLITFLPVTDQEVLDHYTFSNRKVKISFVQFLPEKFKKSVKFDPTAMEKYFDEHKEEYRVPDKIKIAHITIDPSKFRDQVAVKDREVEDYYEENLEVFKQKRQVRARHILFKLAQDAPEQEEEKVKEKALSVLKRAREGDDFAALAKKHSEGPTAKKGGDLGYFSPGQMVKPFEEGAYKLKKGEISDLVRTPFGYHIIKVEDIKEARTKPLEEVKEQIKETLRNMTSTDLAHEKALTLIDQMPYEVDLSQYAERHQVPITESGYFSEDEAIPEIEGDEKLRQSLFSLQKNEVSELLEFKGEFYIIQIVDKRPSYLPEMKEVDEKLRKDFSAHLAKGEARSAAEKYLTQLKGGEDWKQLAKKHGFSTQTTDFFSRNDFISQIGYAPDLQEAAFQINKESRYADDVFENKKGVFVIKWEEQKEIDEKKYKEDKERYRYSLMQAKHQAILQDWLDNLKERAQIEIVQPVSSQ